jgi:hypothetical protein
MLLHLSPHKFTARVVVLMTISQFNASFNVSGLTGCVGLTSVVKSSHDVLRENPGPRSLAWVGLRLAKAR